MVYFWYTGTGVLFYVFFHAWNRELRYVFYITYIPHCGNLGLKTCADNRASIAPTFTSTLTASKPASIVQNGAYEPHTSSVPPVSLTKKPPSLATRERRKRNQKWKKQKPAAAGKWHHWCRQRGPTRTGLVRTRTRRGCKPDPRRTFCICFVIFVVLLSVHVS